MELRGAEPVVPTRGEIMLKGKVIAVDEFSQEKTITIQIPLDHLATLSEQPIITKRNPDSNIKELIGT